MPETIYKLQPDRTAYISAFGGGGAVAAMYEASPAGFKVSGNFRDNADYAVIRLYDVDNGFAHLRFRYLPDWDFSGMTLQVDLNYTNLQPIDSPKFDWNDWGRLVVIRPDSTQVKINLFAHAMLQSGAFGVAGGTISLSGNTATPFDEVRLWLANVSWAYVVPGKLSVEYAFFVQGAGYDHSVTIAGVTYHYIEQVGDTGLAVRNALKNAVNAGAGDPNALAADGSAANILQLTRKLDTGVETPLAASDGNANDSIWQVMLTTVARKLAELINQADWNTLGMPHALLATAAGTTIEIKAARYGYVNAVGSTVTRVGGAPFGGIAAGSTIVLNGNPYTVAVVNGPQQLTTVEGGLNLGNVMYTAERGGYDGNVISIYSTRKGASMTVTPATLGLGGGSSEAIWRVTIDFTAEGADQVHACYLTLAARRPNGTAYPTAPESSVEFTALFSNWTVTDPLGKRALKVGGPGSVLISAFDSFVQYSGLWGDVHQDFGYFLHSRARWASSPASYLDAEVNCQYVHDIWIGVGLHGGVGILEARLDGGAPVLVDCYSSTQWFPSGRRKLFANVGAGKHIVRIAPTGTKHPAAGDVVIYVDCVQAVVVAGDVPDPGQSYSDFFGATDWDTAHTLAIPPQRLLWMFIKSGVLGPLNHYMGIGMYHRRKRHGGVFPTWKVYFSDISTWADGDTITFTFSAASIMVKTLKVPGDSNATLLEHFRAGINETFTGIWSEIVNEGGVNKLVVRPLSPGWNFDSTAAKVSANGVIYTEGNLRFDNQLRTVLSADAIDGAAITITTSAPHGYVDGQVVWIKNNALVSNEQDPGLADAIWEIYDSTLYTFKLLGSAGHGSAAGGTAELVLDGVWKIDDSLVPVLNKPTVDWHRDLFRELRALGREAVISYSMEFTNPPDDPSAPATVWIARYANNRRVKTGWASHHCAFTSAVLTYQKRCYEEIAALQASEGLRPWLQAGEHIWWPTGNTARYPGPVDMGGMAYYDADTKGAALASLGRPLYVFRAAIDDPGVNWFADATFLRQRIADHVLAIKTWVLASVPSAKFEVLWQLDANSGPPIGYSGQLTEYVNTPPEFKSKGLFDRFKMETLAFGAYDRNVAKAARAISWAFTEPGWSWSKADCAYMIPIWNSGVIWEKEYLECRAQGIPLIGVWAFDHLMKQSWPLPLPREARRAQFLAG